VDVRIVVMVDIFIVFLSFGAIWINVDQNGSPIPDAYNGFQVSGMVGGYIGGLQVNPPSYQATDFGAYTQAVLASLIVGNMELDAAMVAIPAALLLALASFVRWRLLLLAGILETVGGVLWRLGIPAISQQAGSQLAAWQGFGAGAPNVSVSSSLGPDFAVAAGVLLGTTYLLTVKEKLDPPLDSGMPVPST